MHSLHASLDPEGAQVDALVGPAATDVQTLRSLGRAIPPPVAVRALIDPGAEVSCVDSQVVPPLLAVGVLPTRYVFVNLPATGGLAPTPEYAVTLTIVHPSGNARANLV